MAEINTLVYGIKSSWIDIITYDESVPAENRVKYANFGDNQTSILKAYTANKLPLGTPWDKSLSYAALGNKMPLSNIQYWYGDKDSSDPLILTVLNQDERLITNYALGTSGGFPAYEPDVQGMGNIVVEGEEFAAVKARYNRYTNGAEYSSSYTAWVNFSPFTQIPVKRCVLVPYVEAYRTDFSYGTQFELTDYLLNRKAEYNKITRIFVSICVDDSTTYDPETGTGSPSRFSNFSLCAGVVLDPLSYGNGFIQDGIELDDIFKPIIGNAIAGALYNKDLVNNWTTSTTWCVPIASGFDLDFTKIYALNQDGEITSNSRFYCDADELSTTQIRESVRKIVAGFGLFFADNLNDAQTKKLDDPAIMLGILENGVGNGDYSSGLDNRNELQWTLQDAHDIDYDPADPPIILPPSVPTTFNAVNLADGGLKRYVLDDTAMQAFSDDLWNIIDTSDPDELIQNQTLTNFLTNNPLDAVVSVKRFALADMSQGSATNIHLGKVVMSASAKPFTSDSTILSCGFFDVPRFFNDFRDFLLQIIITLPFCGTLQLDPQAVVGKRIEIKYSIDYTTGTCTAWVLAPTSDNGSHVVIDSASGNCSVDIPLSGVQTATLTGQLYNANETLKSAKYNGIISGVNAAGSFVSSVKNNDFFGALNAAAGVVDNIHDISVLDWNVQHTEVPFKMIGASSGCNAMQLELTPRITIYSPVIDPSYDESAYLHSVGAAVCDATVLSAYENTGYLEATNLELNFAATAAEKDMIRSLCAGGIYI